MPNIALFIVLTFILADNALCNTKDTKSFVPLLRAAFSIGSHLSYHQIEGMMPRGYDYIVGDVTISLARLIEKAHPKQILIGEFKDTSAEANTADGHGRVHSADKRLIRKFHGVSLGDTPISELNLSLTNSRKCSGQGHSSHPSPKKYHHRQAWFET